MDNIPKELLAERGQHEDNLRDTLTATLMHLRHKEQILLVPITMYSGLEQAAFGAEFTKVS